MRKRDQWIGLGVCLLLMMWFILHRDRNEVGLMLQNQSAQTIDSLVLDIGDQRLRFERVPDGARIRNRFSVHHDHPIETLGALADGTRLDGVHGVVQAGVRGQFFVLRVGEGGAVLLLDDPRK